MIIFRLLIIFLLLVIIGIFISETLVNPVKEFYNFIKELSDRDDV